MVEANSVIPLYKQIVRALSDSIANGTYRPGDKLPTEAELIEQFGVSRITVRSAIKEMEDAGLVERARGKGTFVLEQKEIGAARAYDTPVELLVDDMIRGCIEAGLTDDDITALVDERLARRRDGR